MSFFYQGPMSSSKSLFNRALILKSFYPELEIIGTQKSQDIQFLESCISDLLSGKTRFFVGEGGTSLRFFLSRLSRTPGCFEIEIHPRLLQRPHEDLFQALATLGVQTQITTSSILVTSQGWQQPNSAIKLSLDTSSQFLSSLLLSSWELPFDLNLEILHSQHTHLLQNSYSGMTLTFLKKAGLNLYSQHNHITVPGSQRCSLKRYAVEPDWSSLAAILMAAQISGNVVITIPSDQEPSQPDAIIIDLLKKMNGNIEVQSAAIKAQTAHQMNAIQFTFEGCPDLVPCFAVLCSFAKGQSILTGLHKLVYKESDRIQNTLLLLQLAGVQVTANDSSLVIEGMGSEFTPQTFCFDPDQDHRMAMAAALFKLKNDQIKILNPEVVNKSFINFWEILGFIG